MLSRAKNPKKRLIIFDGCVQPCFVTAVGYFLSEKLTTEMPLTTDQSDLRLKFYLLLLLRKNMKETQFLKLIAHYFYM